MRIRIISGLLFTLIFIQVSGQDLRFPELQGYRINIDFPVFVPDNLWDYIDGAAETYLTYGFVNLRVAEYKKGKNVIKLEIYRLGDHIMAFGIYSNERSSSYKFLKLGAQGYKTGGAINFFKGDFYVKIRTYSKNEKTLLDAESLAVNVADMIEGSRDMPAVLSLFPLPGKKINDEMFISGNVLGHKFLTKSFKANYEAGPDIFSVFIFDTGSPEAARKMAGDYLASSGLDDMESESAKYVISDGYNGTIFLAWKESRMVVISGLSKDQAEIANKYTSDILK